MLKCEEVSFPYSLVDFRALEVGQHDDKNLGVKCCPQLVCHEMSYNQEHIISIVTLMFDKVMKDCVYISCVKLDADEIETFLNRPQLLNVSLAMDFMLGSDHSKKVSFHVPVVAGVR